MLPSLMLSFRKQWQVAGIAFVLGTAVAAAILRYAVLHQHGDLGWFVQIPVIPGVILAAPFYILTGGVHGDYADVWFWSVAPLNGVAYAQATLLLVRLIRFSTNCLRVD